MAHDPDWQRPKITSLWIIISLVAYAITAAMYFLSPDVIMQSLNASIWFVRLQAAVSLAGIVGDVFLLRWKGLGFWIFVGTSLVSLVLNITLGMKIGQILYGLIGIAIMWGVLHIRKNGSTTWEQLE